MNVQSTYIYTAQWIYIISFGVGIYSICATAVPIIVRAKSINIYLININKRYIRVDSITFTRFVSIL